MDVAGPVKSSPKPQELIEDLRIDAAYKTLQELEVKINGLLDKINEIDQSVLDCKTVAKKNLRILRDNGGLLKLDANVKRLNACIQELQLYQDAPSSAAIAIKYIDEYHVAHGRKSYVKMSHLKKLYGRAKNGQEWAKEFVRKQNELTEEIAALTQQCLEIQQKIARRGLPTILAPMREQFNEIIDIVSKLKETRAALMAELSTDLLAEADAAKAAHLETIGDRPIDEWLEYSLALIDAKDRDVYISSKLLVKIKIAADACRRYPTLSIESREGLTPIIRYEAPTELEEHKSARVRFQE